jgi:DNA mismatch repair protein MSH6
MTQAERGKIEAREKKKAEESCFEFLKDLKDVSLLLWITQARSVRIHKDLLESSFGVEQKEGHRVGDPEYDGRTVHIPNKAWNTFSPFEKQFWEIKQNHFDTVLFFQKVSIARSRMRRRPPADPEVLMHVG